MPEDRKKLYQAWADLIPPNPSREAIRFMVEINPDRWERLCRLDDKIHDFESRKVYGDEYVDAYDKFGCLFGEVMADYHRFLNEKVAEPPVMPEDAIAQVSFLREDGSVTVEKVVEVKNSGPRFAISEADVDRIISELRRGTE